MTQSASAPGQPGSSAAARASERLAAALPSAPGLQHVVVGPEAILFEGAAGWADVLGRRPLEPSTTLMAYSMTKTVTAVAALQLVERGVLSLEEPVRSLLPEIPYDGRLRVRHLLAQTSGIPNPLPLRWVHLPEEHAAFDEKAMLARRLAEHPRLRFPPGARYAYSNLSYWLLGRVVEVVSGTAYPAYVRANVLDRLGLSPEEIGFEIPAPGRHARGYLPRWSAMSLLRPLLLDSRFVGRSEGRWLQVKDAYLDGPAFGGLVASARAMASFLRDQLGEESVLLGPEGRRLLRERQATDAGAPIRMTLGWHVAPGPRAFLYKEGGGAGFHSEMRVYPRARIASVAMASSAAFDVKRFLDVADREFGAGEA